MEKMVFFTHPIGISNNYALITLNHFIKKKKIDINKIINYSQKYKIVIIDVGVYQLKKQPYYNFEKLAINFKEILTILPTNVYIPYDFPADMNIKYQELFIKKSFDNFLKYKEYKQFISTIQCKFNDINNFKLSFDKYNKYITSNHYVGLGNMCRINQLTDFIKESIDYAFRYSKSKKIHIFGLSLRNFKYVYSKSIEYNIDLSIDNTKWTKACNQKIRKNFGLCCLKATRQLFFNEYIKSIQKKNINVLF